MAGTFSLNTAGIPGLVQVTFAFSDGAIFDFVSQQASGHVVVSDVLKQQVARSIKGTGGVVVFTEV